MSKYDLKGKVMFATGASGGIGSAAVRMLVAKGAKVVIVDIHKDKVDSLAATLPTGATLPIAADVTDAEQMAQAVAKTVETFGRLDVVWANAGIANDPPVTLATADLKEYEKVIEVDVFGVVRTVKPALEQIIANKGQVVVTGSGYSFVNAVTNTAYGTSKAGVEMFGRSLNLELAAHGASASVLYPGWTKTPITASTSEDPAASKMFKYGFRGPLGKMSAPETIAAGLVVGLQKREPFIFAPKGWALYSWLRGVINPLADRLMARDQKFAKLLLDLERTRNEAGAKR